MNPRVLSNELDKLYACTLINYDRDAASYRDMKYTNKTISKDAPFDNQGDYVEILRMINQISTESGIQKDFKMPDKVNRKEFQQLTSVLMEKDQSNPSSLFQIEKRLESILTKLDFNRYVDEREAERE